MQYMLMLYVNEAGWPKLTKAQQEEGVAAYTAYTEALTKAGVLTGSNRLQPSAAATTVRVANAKPQVLDGPYADSKEQLGGYYIINVADLDEAIAWAQRCPAAGHGVVEVRVAGATLHAHFVLGEARPTAEVDDIDAIGIRVSQVNGWIFAMIQGIGKLPTTRRRFQWPRCWNVLGLIRQAAASMWSAARPKMK